MKSIILSFFIAVGLFFAGCSDQSSISSPQQDPQLSIMQMSNGLHKPVTIKKNIDGTVGGQIDMAGSFDGVVSVDASLTVPAGAFQGSMDISMYMEGSLAVIDFGPTPFTFDIPLNFSMTISGLNLIGVDKKLQFVYIAPNGSLQPIELNGTTNVDQVNDRLTVTNAQIPHFSRYGWAK